VAFKAQGLAGSAVYKIAPHMRIGPNVSDTLFKPDSFLGTTEAASGYVLAGSTGNPFQAPPPLQHFDHPSVAEAPLKITGQQTIRTADELHKAFAEYLNRGLDVVVDLSGVDECDTAALQLIYALRQSAVERKQRFHITAVSPAITGTVAALGLRIEDLMTQRGAAAPDGAREVACEDNGI